VGTAGQPHRAQAGAVRLRLTGGARWATTAARGAGAAAAALGWPVEGGCDVSLAGNPRGLRHIFFYFFLPPLEV
jgi:hypothetical protein